MKINEVMLGLPVVWLYVPRTSHRYPVNVTVKDMKRGLVKIRVDESSIKKFWSEGEVVECWVHPRELRLGFR